MAWTNIPASNSLRAEFNAAFPGRDKSSDGSIGDSAHASSSSDHNPDETANTPYEDSDSINEVHAIDVDSDLRRAGWSMQRVVNIVVDRHKRGLDKRLQNIIYNRRIWSRSYGWESRAYSGSNPHDKHAHFSFRYGSGSGTSNPENITSPWGILAAINKEDDVEIGDLNAELRKKDSALAGISRAIPWQYTGGGIPTGMSTLSVLNATYLNSKATAEMVKIIAARDEVDERVLGQQITAALAPALAAQVTASVVASLADAGVQNVTPEQIAEAVKVGTKAALREGVGQ